MTIDAEKQAGNANRQKADKILDKIRQQRQDSIKTSVEEERIDLVIFTLDDDYYAFYGKDTKEILSYEGTTYVPGCPEYIIGIINVRGDIESVLDIRLLMKLEKSNVKKTSRIIIAHKAGIRSGIMVDSVEDVIDVPVSAVKRPISTLDKSIKEFAVGGETVYNDRYVTILDAGKIFGKINI